MRLLWTGPLLCAFLSACGGETPAPKEPEQASPSAAADDQKHEDDSTPAAPAAAAAAPAPAPAASAAPTELKASSDDVWMAGHQMPPADVLKTMRPQQGKVHACFSAGVKRDPSTSGEIKVKFVITNDGAVRAWKDDGSSMTDADVTKCVGELVKNLRFPKQKSPGDAWGTYSANFSR